MATAPLTTDARPASIGQRQLWLMDHYQGAHGALNCPIILRLTGALDLDALGRALDAVTARHEALRTTFTGRGRRLAREVHPALHLPVSIVDLTGTQDPDLAAADELRVELRTRIDVTTEPVRVTLWRVGSQVHLLCVNQHHLVTDAWSCAMLSRELGEIYGGRAEALPAVGWQFSDFVAWQQATLTGDDLHRHQDYWRAQLDGTRVPALPAPAARAPAAERTIDFARVAVDAEVAAGTARVARENRTTPFAVLLTAFYVLLHEYTGQTDLVVATLLANRSRPETRNTVGYLANMVLLRTPFPEAGTAQDLLRATRKTVIGALVHQELPYQMLPLDTIRADAVRDVVFQVFAEATHQTEFGAANGLRADPVDPPGGLGNRFDLDCVVMPDRGSGGYEVVLGYAQDRFGREWATTFLARYAAIAEVLARAPEERLLRGQQV